tara:strand:+ start:4345 stop:6087 length:1743 start_codon:yes stop_codon:yes gene_type:complete
MAFPVSMFRQVVVIEVIDDAQRYSLLTPEELSSLFESKKSKEPEKSGGIFSVFNSTKSAAYEVLKKQILCCPKNSIVGLDVTANENDGVVPRIYYPFFQSHFSLPVKPGEHVWVFTPGVTTEAGAPAATLSRNLSDAGKNEEELLSFTPSEVMCEGYWMSRICLPRYAEDLNFSHADRSKSLINISEQTSKKGGPEIGPPQFNNGIGSNENRDIKTSKTLRTDLDYEDINSLAKGSSLTTREAVPRFTSRPGDLVLQGSNNTLICLGEDRPSSSVTEESSVNYKLPEGEEPNKGAKPVKNLPRLKGYQGSIDIVAGRSAAAIINPELEVNLRPPETPTITDKNSREYEEVEKRTWTFTDKDKRQGSKKDGIPSQNILEGDPNFITDLSRVYISMKTNGDENLGYTEPSLLPRLGNDPTFNPVADSPYVITKSKEVRIIASHPRQADGKFLEDTTDAGSVRIIKEGQVDEEGHPKTQACILMNPTGTMLIDSPSIVIGSGKENENGEGTQVYIGNNATEPIVLGGILRDLLSSLLTSFEQNAPNFVATGTGPGILNPSIVSEIARVKGQLDSFLSKNAKTK